MKTRHILRMVLPCLLATTGMAQWLPTCEAQPTVSQKLIVRDIRKGVDYLLSKERPHKLWERGPGVNYFNDIGGKTALVTEALIDGR